jgi:ABC-type transport system involved in Fe-S cluster assembly fused permease/ATPase subunit
VIDDGRLVEHGRHDELVAGGGRYATLFAAWLAHTP